MNLCLDTGHISYCDGNNVEIIRRFPERITYVHLKQVEPEVRERVRREKLSLAEAVPLGMMCEPPFGEPDTPELLAALAELDRDIYAVIEQNLYPVDPHVPLPIQAGLPGTSAPADSAPSDAGRTDPTTGTYTGSRALRRHGEDGTRREAEQPNSDPADQQPHDRAVPAGPDDEQIRVLLLRQLDDLVGDTGDGDRRHPQLGVDPVPPQLVDPPLQHGPVGPRTVLLTGGDRSPQADPDLLHVSEDEPGTASFRKTPCHG
ncbi:MAG: IolE protein [Pseudonocardia sp.]|nr:hypothetical protein [Pseudonocardia sp.]MCW2721404.1 IolE protein [Pseudonocardia sp.]MDT7614571.1 inosose dehydratase [Pseudonocardiales bacterium]